MWSKGQKPTRPVSQGRASIPRPAQLEDLFPLSVGLVPVPPSLFPRVSDCIEAPFRSLLPPGGAPCPLCSCVTLCQVHKLLIVVELLLGEIPDRLQFRQPSLKRSLMPYFLLTQGKGWSPPRACRTPGTVAPFLCAPCAAFDPLLSPLQLSGRETWPSSTRSWISLGRSFKQMGPTPSSSDYDTTSSRQVWSRV